LTPLAEQENRRYRELNLHSHAGVGVFMSPSLLHYSGQGPCHVTRGHAESLKRFALKKLSDWAIVSDKVVTKQHAEAPTEADISALCWRMKLIEYVAVVNVEAIPGGASLDSVHSSAPAMGDMARL
jgi:hypothetical protein